MVRGVSYQWSTRLNRGDLLKWKTFVFCFSLSQDSLPPGNWTRASCCNKSGKKSEKFHFSNDGGSLTKLSPLWKLSNISIIFHNEKIASKGFLCTHNTLSNFFHQFRYSCDSSSNGSCWNTGKWAFNKNLLSALHSPGLLSELALTLRYCVYVDAVCE